MPETLTDNAKPETAESKVRRALEAAPATTAIKLASAAGVGRSTATKILSRWAAEGLVTRTNGKDQSVPVTWTWGGDAAEETLEAAETNEDADERKPDLSLLPAPGPVPAALGDPAAQTSKKERLPKGALYELVREFLHEHPDEEFGPAKIGAELERSSGAVNNALEKLVTNGLATKTHEAPKRFTSR
jgi:predicted transcriptional regulator